MQHHHDRARSEVPRTHPQAVRHPRIGVRRLPRAHLLPLLRHLAGGTTCGPRLGLPAVKQAKRKITSQRHSLLSFKRRITHTTRHGRSSPLPFLHSHPLPFQLVSFSRFCRCPPARSFVHPFKMAFLHYFCFFLFSNLLLVGERMRASKRQARGQADRHAIDIATVAESVAPFASGQVTWLANGRASGLIGRHWNRVILRMFAMHRDLGHWLQLRQTWRRRQRLLLHSLRLLLILARVDHKV